MNKIHTALLTFAIAAIVPLAYVASPTVAVAAEKCTKCNGRGVFVCDNCNGTGKKNSEKCPNCNGRGKYDCTACNGTGTR